MGEELSVETAKAIINEAIAGGFSQNVIPEADDEIVSEAKYWLEEARKAHEAGMQHDTVVSIINIAEFASYSEPSPVVNEPSFRTDPVENTKLVTKKDDPIPDEVTDSGSRNFIATRHNLPVPKEWEDQPKDMPRDISEVTDKGIRSLSGEYNAYTARAKWLLALAISDLAQATHLRDNAYRASIKKVPKIDPETEKSKLKEVIDAEARDDKEFSKYDAAVLKHQHDVTIYKALVDIYGGNVDRLSREWTMRTDEYERSK